jgi:sulfofructose kinase
VNENKKARVLVCGRSTIDIIMRLDSFSDQPIKQFASEFKQTVGGPAANAAIAIARHGGDVQLITKMGSDQFAQFLSERLINENIKILNDNRTKNSRSSVSVALIDKAGERQTINFGGSGFIFPSELEGISVPDIVLADNRYPKLTKAAIDFAKQNNISVVIDAEAPFDAEDVWGASHIAFSMQGFRSYLSSGTIENDLHKAQLQLQAWLCVTDGPNGVWIANQKQVYRIPSFLVKTADSVGAGDIWHGVFSLQLARGHLEEDAVRYANAAAALKCKKFGGIDSCPYTNETEEFLQEWKSGTDSW